MMISVLIPTRKRPHLIDISVRSVLSQAHDPSRIEIVIAHDHDDTESQLYFSSTAWTSLLEEYHAQAQVFETPAWGYSSLHTYYNFLAGQCRGDWMLIWNDDALIRTPGWDSAVDQHQDFVGMLHMITENYRPKFALFPLIPRAWIELFGCVGENPVDSWIHHVSMQAQAIQVIEPRTYHDRYDMTGANLDETYLARDTGAIKKNYKSPESRALRQQWAQRLIEYRQSLGL